MADGQTQHPDTDWGPDDGGQATPTATAAPPVVAQHPDTDWGPDDGSGGVAQAAPLSTSAEKAKAELEQKVNKTGIIKGSLLEKAFKLFNPGFEGGIDPEDLKKADEQGLTAKGQAKKVFFGEGSAATTELSPEVKQDIEGLKSMFKGHFGDAWDKLIKGEVGSVHVVKGSPLEGIIQSFDPDFQGGITEDEVTQWKRKFNAGERPIADLGTLVDKDKNPMLKAIAEAAGSMTSPENMAMIGSGGALGIVGGGPQSVAVLHKLFSAGFGIAGLKGLYEHSAAFKNAMDNGDYNEAVYQATHAILAGTMTAMASHDVAHTTRYDANGNIIPSLPVMSEFDKKVAGKVGDVATSAREYIKDKIPQADTIEDLWYKLAKPSALQNVAGKFEATIGKAMPALKEIIGKNSVVETPEDVYKVTKQFQNSVRDQLIGASKDPNAVIDGMKASMEKKLNEAFDNSKASYTDGERAKAIASVMEHMTVDEGKSDVSLLQAEKARKRFNDDIEPEFGKPVEAVPSAEMFAKGEAAKIARDAIDKKFGDMGVQGVQEWRDIESALIDVRDQVGKAQNRANELGEFSLWKSFFKKLGWHSLVAGMFGLKEFGAEGLALPLATNLLSVFHEWAKDRNTNPNTLIDRIVKQTLKENAKNAPPSVQPQFTRPGPQGPTPGPGGAGLGPQRPGPGPRFVPGEGGGLRFTPDGVEGLRKEVSPVNSPLHTALADFYNEPLGDNFEDLENRFLTQVVKKNMQGIGLTDPEKKVLSAFNKYRETAPAEQAKLDEKAKADAQAEADKKAEQEEKGQNTNLSEPFEVGEEIDPGEDFAGLAARGHSMASIRAHELGHHIITGLLGWLPKDVISHLHDMIRKRPDGTAAAWAEARWDKSPFFDENGKIDREAVKNNINELLDKLHGGPIAEEIVHGIPLEKNVGAGGDLNQMKKALKVAGFKDGEIGALMKASELRVRKTLTSPGVRDIIDRYTRNREAGLEPGVHMSEETVGKAIQEVKSLGVTHGSNEGKSAGEGAGKLRENVGAGEGGIPGEGKEGERPAGETGAVAGKGGEQTGEAEPGFATEVAAEPTKINYIRNLEKAPDMGERFGQHIEPAGRYMTEAAEGIEAPKGYEKGTVEFQKPLVMDFGGGYQEPTNWKRVLSDRFGGKTGKALSTAIKKAGYDGIITKMPSGETSEIVDLTGGKKAEPTLSSEFAETEDQKKGLISTRQPEGKFATEDPLKQDLKIGAEQFQEPKFMAKVANKIKSYADLAIPDAIKKDPAKIVGHFINHLKNNLVDLHNQVPAEVREQTAKWYDSASGFAKNMAEKYGYDHKQGAGVIAAMSPQKDWDQNVSLAERVTETHATQKNTVTSKAMEIRGKELAKARNAKGALTNPSMRKILPAIKGKTLGEVLPTADMSEKQQAVALERAAGWVRLFDEVNNPRSYQKIDPGTGNKMGEVLTDAGEPRKVAWGSLNEIGKALSILQDGSRENISNQLGGAHKVRNFYNNILDPNNPAGHVTIDTHAVAAAHQQPFSGKSPEVQANFGGIGSKGTGSRGLYGLYAEAYRQAAQQLGIQPRQLQSIVWEKVRQQFPDEFKRAADGGHVKAIRDLWSDYDTGEKGLDETREAVRQYARENTGGKEGQ